MNRFTVSQFASDLYGQNPLYGFRIFDHKTESAMVAPVFIASFPTLEQAQAVADLLNTHTN